VISLLEDGEEICGLHRWRWFGMVRPSKIQTIEPPDQWQGRAVLSVTASRNGSLWIGTEGAGLYRFQDGTWSNFGPEQGSLIPMSGPWPRMLRANYGRETWRADCL